MAQVNRGYDYELLKYTFSIKIKVWYLWAFYFLKLSDGSGWHTMYYYNEETLDSDIKYELMMMDF
jgi:hypothetical protein